MEIDVERVFNNSPKGSTELSNRTERVVAAQPALNLEPTTGATNQIIRKIEGCRQNQGSIANGFAFGSPPNQQE
jgi:hypothetical protein